jgi:DNA-binding NarL/FixJ family response regulator
MTPGSIAVVVVSAQQLRRRGLELALAKTPKISVAGVTADLRAGSQLAQHASVTGMVVDIECIDDAGVAELHHLHRDHGVAIVCFATADDSRVATVSSFAHVLDAREGVDQAVPVLLDPNHAQQARERRPAPQVTAALTTREREILESVARGCSSAETASELGITAGTVRVHKRNLYGKLGVRSQAEAVAVALNRRLLEPHSVAS